LVITGEGRGFCTGADVKQMASGLGVERKVSADRTSERGIIQLAPRIREIPQPVIMAINGVTAGGGLGLALSGDIRIASELARFSCIFVKRSLVPDTASSYTLPQLVGFGIASEMALTGNIYDAQWAERVGLVNRVVPAAELMETALALANDIAANPPLAVRSIKQLMNSWYENMETAIYRESDANIPNANTADRREAVLSFVEKRAPVFFGR